MSELEHLAEILNKAKPGDLRLYIIFRNLKDGVGSNKKMLDKFEFSLKRLDIVEELQNSIFDISKNSLLTLINSDKELCEYDISENEKDVVYSYTTKNKIESFEKILGDLKRPSSIESFDNLYEYYNSIWAYGIRFLSGNEEIFIFKRLYKQKVAVNSENLGLIRRVRAYFNTKSKLFELLEGETITFDTDPDCIYHNDCFYIFNKNNFESIVNLEQEFQNNAFECSKELGKGNYIIGLNILEEEIKKNPSLNKKLSKIKNNGYHINIDKKRIKSMKGLAKKFNLNIHFSGDKIEIQDPKDIPELVKLLDDYYVQSMQELGYYGSHSKKKLNV